MDCHLCGFLATVEAPQKVEHEVLHAGALPLKNCRELNINI
jgi:hypothetical protein